MMQLSRIAQTTPVRWKNGGGVTRDLLLWPPGARVDNWQLRISVAEVVRNGPFSAYPGVARWFCVLQGDGVVLTLNGQGQGQGQTQTQTQTLPQTLTYTLTPDSPPLHFDGASAPGCRLLGGPTLDLNLMARQDAGRAEMARAVAGIGWSSSARLRAVYARDACTLRAGAAPPLALRAGTLAFNDAARGDTWQLVGDNALAWWLSFEPHAR